MAVYADPTRCPDCRSMLPPSPGTCPACGLPLDGPLIHELFATLQHADELLGRLRAAEVMGNAPAESLLRRQDGAEADLTGRYPQADRGPRPERPGLSAPSVPRILLGLGALCLLVAAVTFLAFAWAWLGVGGRTAVLVTLTAVAALLAERFRRRALRIAAESLAVVSLGLLVLDVAGADNAGWLGTLSGGELLGAGGFALAALGLAGTVVARLRGGEPLVAPQLAVVAGLWVGAFGLGADHDQLTMTSAVAAGGFLVVLVAARSAGLPVLSTLAALAAASWWLPLAAVGLLRAVEHPSVTELAGDAQAWPLLTAAALLAVASRLARETPHAEATGYGVAATMVSALPLLVTVDDHGAAWALTAVALTVGWTVALLVLPRAAAVAAAIPLAASSAAVLVPLAGLLVEAVDALGSLLPPAWAQPWDVTVPPVAGIEPTGAPALLVVPLLVVATVAAAALWERLPGRGRPTDDALVPFLAVVTLGVAATLASYERPLAAVLALTTLAALALVAWGERRLDQPGLAGVSLGGVVLLVTTALALPSTGLTAAALAVLLAVVSAMALRGRAAVGRRAAALVVPMALGALGWTLGELAGMDPAWRAAPLMLLLGLLAIRVPRPEVEIPAAATGALLAALSIGEQAEPATPLALHLTLGGALLVASSVANADRRWLAWGGGVLLAAATWVRLWDVGVTTPEAYTLPSALALCAVGLVRLARQSEADTWSTISAGLLLATVPSLVEVYVGDPASLRALLLGAGCLALVLGGARLRWSAPLLVGAGVGALLVLVECGPYAADVPSWVLIGAAGTLLLVVGVTWEARLLELRRGAAYLARLR